MRKAKVPVVMFGLMAVIAVAASGVGDDDRGRDSGPAPKGYVCYRASAPIRIDGRLVGQVAACQVGQGISRPKEAPERGQSELDITSVAAQFLHHQPKAAVEVDVPRTTPALGKTP